MSVQQQPLLAAKHLSEGYWEPWRSGQDPLLHHYTDAAGLHGIITTKKLWLTGISYLNDATEHQQAGVAVRKAVELMRENSKNNERQDQYYEYLESMFDAALNVPRIEAEKDTFVVCFSTKSDSLSQWRSYGRGEGGFSIVFRSGSLWDFKKKVDLSSGYWLLPCEYNIERIVNLNRIFIEEALEELLVSDPGLTNEFIAMKSAIDARWIGAGVKHPAFSEEEEWRLIYYGFNGTPPEIYHRANSTLTPYIKFPLGEKNQVSAELIEEVWVGPQRHPELAAAATRDFLRRELGKDIPVKISKIPFRTL